MLCFSNPGGFIICIPRAQTPQSLLNIGTMYILYSNFMFKCIQEDDMEQLWVVMLSCSILISKIKPPNVLFQFEVVSVIQH